MKIIDIKRGDGPRSKWVYANLVSDEGDLLVSATIDYIAEALMKRIEYYQKAEQELNERSASLRERIKSAQD